MNLCKSILRGFHQRRFPEIPFYNHKTYSSMRMNSVTGFYADREDTPEMFVLLNPRYTPSVEETLELSDVFAALSDKNVLTVIHGIISKKIVYGKVYDAESLCGLLNLDDAEFPSSAERMVKIGVLSELDLPYDNEKVRVYKVKRNLNLLISLVILLFKCGTDGNY